MKTGFVALILIVVVSVTAGCGLFSGMTEDSGEGGGAIQDQYNSAIKDAESSYKEVDQLGAAWAYTEDLITEAKQKASQNKLEEALALAKEALQQSKSAKEQMEGQKKAGPYLF